MKRTLLGAGFLGLSLVTGGCSCEGETVTEDRCTVAVATINGSDASGWLDIGADDDADLNPDNGIQIDVTVATTLLSDGEQVTLSGGSAPATAGVAAGVATFTGYTVSGDAATQQNVRLEAQATQDCTSETWAGVVGGGGAPEPSCQFLVPADGSEIRPGGEGDDLATPNTIEIDVLLSTQNAPDGSGVALTVGGAAAGSADVAGNAASFGGVGIDCPDAEENVALGATVTTDAGGTADCTATLTVNCAMIGECDITDFDPPCPDVPTLGTTCSAAEDQDLTEDGLQIDVCVATDAPDGATVQIDVDGSEVGEGTADGGEACVRVTLPEGPVTLVATCTSDGNMRISAPFGAYVDSEAPDAVDDLGCVVIDAADPATIECTFTVPSDPGVDASGAETVELCWDTATFDETGFDALTTCVTIPAGAPGSEQSVQIVLAGGLCYWFAAEVTDLATNVSGMSNLAGDPDGVCVGTDCTIAGFTPPAVTTALGTTLNATHDGDGAAGVQATVNVTSDVGDGGEVTLSVNGADGTGLGTLAGGAASLVDTLPEGTVTLVATCDGPGGSVDSAPTTVFVDSVPPPGVTDLACAVTDNRTAIITCNWTPPADVGFGLAGYDFRYVRNGDLATPADFAGATVVTPAPGAGASSADAANDADNLVRLGSAYDFGLVSMDIAGNTSALSNDIAGVGVGFIVAELSGVEVDDQFGQRLATGDFNCDGFGDVAVAAPGGASGNGRAYLFFGSTAGLPAVADAQITGSVAGGALAASIAGLGDFDGDGCDDLAVGGADPDLTGRANVYLGRAFWFDRTETDAGIGAELRIVGGTSFAFYGLPLAGPGDVDGDGLNDLAAYAGEGGDEVQVVYGRTLTSMDGAGGSVLPATLVSPGDADVRFQQPDYASSPWAYEFGWFGLGGGDFDGDGLADLVVGATAFPTANGGAAYILFGAPADATPGAEVISATDAARAFGLTGFSDSVEFGYAVDAVGDIDGGGNHLAVGDPLRASVAGGAFLFEVAGPGTAAAPDVIEATIANVEASPAGGALGGRVAGAQPWACGGPCDLDGDGLDDFVVGALSLDASPEGGVLAYFGMTPFEDRDTNDADVEITAPPGASSFGLRVSFVPDANGDGFVDLVVGNVLPPAAGTPGSVYVYQ